MHMYLFLTSLSSWKCPEGQQPGAFKKPMASNTKMMPAGKFQAKKKSQMLPTHTNISCFLWWHEGPPTLKKSLYFLLYMSHRSVITPPNSRCSMNITLSLKCSQGPLLLQFPDHRSYAREPHSTTFFQPEVMSGNTEEGDQKNQSGLRTNYSHWKHFSFAFISLPHSSPIILGWVLLRSYYQLSMATWKPSQKSYMFILKTFHSIQQTIKCPKRPTCPCKEGLWLPKIQIPKLE